jgi:hypothetical protein
MRVWVFRRGRAAAEFSSSGDSNHIVVLVRLCLVLAGSPHQHDCEAEVWWQQQQQQLQKTWYQLQQPHH